MVLSWFSLSFGMNQFFLVLNGYLGWFFFPLSCGTKKTYSILLVYHGISPENTETNIDQPPFWDLRIPHCQGDQCHCSGPSRKKWVCWSIVGVTFLRGLELKKITPWKIHWVVVSKCSNICVIFCFHPYFGEMIQFGKYFTDGLKPPTS